MKVQIGIFECTGIMGQDLVHPYIQSTTVPCDLFQMPDDNKSTKSLCVILGTHVMVVENTVANIPLQILHSV